MDKYKNILSDPEFWFILAFNVFIAWGYDDGLLSQDTIVWIYFLQSVLIGVGNAVRMAFLKKFSTENFQVNGQSVEPTAKTKWSSTLFFTFHYGFFHFVYFIFLCVASINNGSKLDSRMVMINAMAIAANTFISTWSSILHDREESPAISTLFFTPYFRIVPMHIFIIVGMTMNAKPLVSLPILGPIHPFWLFLLLKTIFDLLMHIVVQKSWRGKRIKPMGGFI